MFGFHRRDRSLIPVGDLAKDEKMEHRVGRVEEDWTEEYTSAQQLQARRNLTMIYLLFLAEAIMASSLSSQISILVPTAGGCSTINTSYLRSLLECAYFFGSATGVFWGLAADRFGRRSVAVFGLVGMSGCCVCMGFANTLAAFAALRFCAGTISSAVTISGLAMIGDITHGSSARTTVVARLPLVAVGGSIGPLLSNMVRHIGQEHLSGVWKRWPALSGQIACAGLVFAIALTEAFLLKETLTTADKRSTSRIEDADCEKGALLGLGRSFPNESSDSLEISIVDSAETTTAATRLTIVQLITAPSLLVLIASYSMLSLHSSTFEVLLPHLGHTASSGGGLGIACNWLAPVMMAVKVLAAIRILHFLPKKVSRAGLLPVYRRISMAFPVLYVLVPTIGMLVTVTGASPLILSVFSTLTVLAKTVLAGAAQVLVLLLVLSAAPDAMSTATVIGLVSVSELFKALAVGATGLSYFLSHDYSTLVVNATSWAALAATALVGAAVAWRLRETPRVGTDFPEEGLVWQGMFDTDSDTEEL